MLKRAFQLNTSVLIILFVLLTTGCMKRAGSIFTAQMTATGTNFLFAAVQPASGNGQIVCFSSDLDALRFDELATITVGDSPRAIEHFRRTLYVANYTTGSISVLQYDPSSCALSLLQTITGLAQVTSLLVNSSYNILYAGYASGIQRYTVASDGTLTILGSATGFGGAVEGMMLAPASLASTLYVNRANDTLYAATIGAAGALTPGSTVGFTAITSMDLGTNGNTQGSFLFVSDSGADTVRTFSIAATTGALTLIDTEVVTDPQSVRYYAYTKPSLFVQSLNGTLQSYAQADAGTLSSYFTNSEMTDTMTTAASMENVNSFYFSVGTSGGIYSWFHSVEDNGISLKLRRQKSLASYGPTVTAVKGVVVQ